MRRSSIKYSDSILDLASLELGAERHSKPPAGDDPFARPDDADTALRTPTPRSAAAARDLDLYAAYDSDGAVSDASVDEGVVLAEALGRGGTPPPVATMLDCWLHTSAFCGARELGRLSSSCVGFARRCGPSTCGRRSSAAPSTRPRRATSSKRPTSRPARWRRCASLRRPP